MRALFLILIVIFAGSLAAVEHPNIDREVPAPRRILFIGNSLISWKGSWATGYLRQMIDGSQVACTVHSLTQGGKGLDYHWDTGTAKTMISENNYDIVVLQNHSSGLNETYTDLFDQFIRDHGAKTLLYQSDSDPFSSSEAADYAAYANGLGSLFNPVAEIVNTAGLQPRHSDNDGKYLKALSFYYRLFGEFPSGGPEWSDAALFATMKNAITSKMAPYIDLDNMPERVATPTISADEEIFSDGSTVVTLSTATSDAVIRYTLDGTVPDETSTIYSGPLSIDQTVNLTAYATKSGFHASGWNRLKITETWSAHEKLSYTVSDATTTDNTEDLNDGSLSSGWFQKDDEVWVVLDLGEIKAIAETRIALKVKADRVYDLDFEVSDDASSWERANWIRDDSGSNSLVSHGIARRARYIRFFNQSDDFLSINEIEIWGADTSRSVSISITPDPGDKWVETDDPDVELTAPLGSALENLVTGVDYDFRFVPASVD